MLEYLSNSSPLIIAGTMEKSFAVWVNGHRLENGQRSADRDRKGTETASRVVVPQSGGTGGEFKIITEQYSLMKAGERYVLFLQEDRRNQLPQQPPDIRRYAITRAWEGTFRIDDENKVRLAPAASTQLREKYGGPHPRLNPWSLAPPPTPSSAHFRRRKPSTRPGTKVRGLSSSGEGVELVLEVVDRVPGAPSRVAIARCSSASRWPRRKAAASPTASSRARWRRAARVMTASWWSPSANCTGLASSTIRRIRSSSTGRAVSAA